MTYQHFLEIIKNATMIKKWPEEYRIYSENSLAIVYCDKNGQVKSFVTNLDGALYHFNATEQKTVQSAIELRKTQINTKGVFQRQNTK